ncbi:NAD(P)H-hydrate dehydratase [Faecalibaculum rodentium]|uniref:NAD(P)H-hydrate dehydratase n=1 Tax=Faecalibaculum rodentium TaxID=1702221 RepID=UPI0023F4DD22|nr:NAD(P)H-hydrate dehydratase [Faecalibaculum rodentium]
MTETLLETAAQAQERDRYTIEQEGIPSPVLMETAARALCSLLESRLVAGSRILILCGPGSNGQDGLAMHRILQEHGWDTAAYCPPGQSLQRRILENRGIPVLTSLTQICALAESLGPDDWIVDAMFGSGLSRPLEGTWHTLTEAANGSAARILAVDVPSGMDGETGPLPGAVIQADLTACIGTRKLGTVLPAALPLTGEVTTLDIGLGNPNTPRTVFELTASKARTCLPVRPLLSWKGTFGKVLMAGGSRRMHGAVEMSARACFHAGPGLLTVAVPEILQPAMRCVLPEAMLLDLPGDPDCISEEAVPAILHAARDMNVVSAGNGMGRQEGTRTLVQDLLQKTDVTLVLDADALSVLDPHWLHRPGGQTILTPHPGEFSRITGWSVSDITANPVKAAQKFTRAYPDTVLVLKGAITCVSEHGQVWVLARPDSSLAKGGSGDMLCGIITGLAASQNPLEAALCGVWAHNQAPLCSKKDPAAFGPQDLVDALSDVWKSLREGRDL